MMKRLVAWALVVAGPLMIASPLWAQDTVQRGSLRPYWFVFIAYAACWLLVMGWVWSIGARFKNLDEGAE